MLQVQFYLSRNWNYFIFKFARCSCSSSSLMRDDLLPFHVSIILHWFLYTYILDFKNNETKLTAAWSCSSLVTPKRSATFSEVIPIGRRQSRAWVKLSICKQCIPVEVVRFLRLNMLFVERMQERVNYGL